MYSRQLKSLLMATAMSLPIAALTLPAVSQAAPAQADSEVAAGSYDIDSQDLQSALSILADKSGRRIDFPAQAVKGKSSTAVVNVHSFDEALNRLLSGTGLVATVRPDGSVLVSTSAAGGVTGVHEVVVTAQPHRGAALLQLNATNTIAVLTPTDMARTPDLDVAESLSRLPGVTVLDSGFTNTNGVGVDEAGRGQGNFVELRGLDAQYNVNTIDGVDVAEGQPYSREVQLNLLPPTGMQKIVVNKTSGAEMDGDAIGGTIDFVTPTAFDFGPGATHGSLTATGLYNDRAPDYNKNGLGGGLSGDIAHKFGDHDQFGVYVGAYYRYETFDNSIVDGIYPAAINGEYTFAVQTAKGGNPAGLNPAKNLELLGVDAGFTEGSTELYGGNFSFDWRPNDDTSAYFRFTYAEDITQQDTSYSQIYANGVSSAPIGSTGLYMPVINNIKPRFYYETNPEDAILETFQTGGSTRIGRLHLSGKLFASYGEDDEPDHIEISARLPEVAPGFPYGGSSMFTYAGQAPMPILTPQEWSALDNIPGYGARYGGEETTEYSNQWKFGTKLDAVYDVQNDVLRSISAGFKYSDSLREHTLRDYTANKLFSTDANDPSFGSLGFLSGSIPAIVPGVYNIPTPLVNTNALWKFFGNNVAKDGGLAALSDECGNTYAESYNCDTQRGYEQVESTYLSADLKFGDLELIPGLRYEHTDIKNVFYELGPDTFGSSHTSYDKLLPSLQANYRPNPLTVYRASVWTSYVAPSMFQLGGGAQYNHNADGTTTITEGNPNLKAIDAINFDASGEWANNSGGFASAAFFYKSLDHFIFDSINSYTNTTLTTMPGYVIYKPENGGAGHVYGLELAGRQKFVGAPGLFDGFGLAGNLTWEQSAVNTGVPGLSRNERLLNQPNWSANAQLFYEKGPYRADLSYRYQGSYVTQYGTLSDGSGMANSLLDTWVHANEQLDLHLGYVTPTGLHFDASVSNLLDADSYDASIGKTGTTIPSYVISGRTFIFKVGYSF